MIKLSSSRRIVIAIFLSLIGVGLISYFNFSEKIEILKKYKLLTKSSVVVEKSSDLIHILQLERGVSLVYLGSKGKAYYKEYDDQFKKSDFVISDFLSVLNEQIEDSGKFRELAIRLGVAEAGLKNLGKIRSDIKKLNLSAEESLDYYSMIITNLIKVIAYVSLESASAKVSATIFPFVAFMEAKDQMGKERAIIGHLLTKKASETKDLVSWAELRGTQKAFFRDFFVYASESQKENLTKVLKSKEANLVEKYRKILETNLEQGKVVSDVNSEKWFSVMTDLIDQLYVFERGLLSDITKVSESVYRRAVTELRVISFVILFLFLTSFYLILTVRKITKPLLELGEVLIQLSKGKLNVNVPFVDAENEIGNIAKSIALFKTSLEERERIQKELEIVRDDVIDKERMTSGIIDNMVDGLITIDKQGIIQSYNQGAGKIFGYSADEVLGENIKMLMPSPYQENHDNYLKNYLTTGTAKIIGKGREVLGLKKDGSVFPMHLGVSKVETKKGLVFSGIVRDISELKEYQNQIIRAKEEAIDASMAKSTFLANMSHELRTPLNAIIGYSEFLIEEAEEGTGSDELVPDLQKIQTSGTHLLNLINQVLDISKVEAGKMDVYLESVSVEKCIEEIKAITCPLIEKNKNKLVIEADDFPNFIEIDYDKFKQIIINLVSNAAKFTVEGTVSLRFGRKGEPTEENLVIGVEDTGIGIPKDKIEKIFEDFSQADESTTRNYGGTGLGLGLCRKFAELMGGKILVESEYGKGSRFSLVMPLKEAVPIHQNEAVKFQDMEQKKTDGIDATILLIDDDPSARDITKRVLIKEGFSIREASNGREGLLLAKEFLPNLIILDVMMPEMDGWETLSGLKENEETRNIPVIMMSMVENESLGFSLGASAYLTKPVQSDLLIKTIGGQMAASTQPILVVDDDPVSRDLAKQTLQKAGYRVLEAENGLQALNVIEGEEKPKIILLDLMMPEMDGFEFLNELEKKNIKEDFIIIVISANVFQSDKRSHLNAAVEKVIQKGSLSPNQLIKDINNLLGLSFKSSQSRK